jgi:PAS domain S-box-containing protein
MRNQRWRDDVARRFRLAVLWICCLGLALPGAASQRASGPRRARQGTEVLFLSSADPDLPDVAAMIEQAETRILNGSATPVHFVFEHVGFSSSLNDPSRSKTLGTAGYLLDKYRGQTFDLVIAINEETFDLAEQMQAKLFPTAGVLFFVVDPRNPSSWLDKKPGRTGVVRKVNFLPTLQMALRQNPGTSRVIVVTGSSEAEKYDMELAREQFRGDESNLEFEYVTNLRFSELGPRLAQAPSDSVILFLDFITDSEGEQFIPARILPPIAKTTNRPIYGMFSSVVGEGVVGGSVADLGEVGRILGNDGVRILNGEKPENIPVATGDFQHYVVDWRQLHRWGFSADQLPDETEVRYWESSPWELYRWRILSLFALLLIETFLIVLLLHNIVSRRRAQKALYHKEVELAEAQRLARVGNWSWDTKNSAFTWSKELYRIHGLDPGTPLSSYKDFAQLFTPESRGRLNAAIEKALQTGYVPELDLELVRADGSKRWVIARGEGVPDTTGQVTYLRGTVQDITERKLAEEAKFMLASIVESSDDAIISKDLDGIITSWNAGALRLFGYTEQEVVGKSIGILIPRELWEEEDRVLQRLRRGERNEHYETVRVTKDGRRVNVSVTVSPVRNSAGKVVGASKIARDISEQQRAEQSLLESEKRFRLVANTAPVMIWMSGLDKLCNYFNQPWLAFTGRSLSAELGNGWTEGVHPEDLKACMETYTKSFDARQPFEMQYRLRRHDGEYRWVFDAAVPRFNEDGSFAGYIGSCADITERKLAEEVLSTVGRRLIEGHEEERSRIARELHDDINQRLALLANGIREFEQATAENRDASQTKQLQELWELTNEIGTDIQTISHQLHPSKLHYLGLATAVRDLCQEFSRQHKFEVECMVWDLPQNLDDNVSLSLFRTVQESLRNVAKHSRASHVKVELTHQSGVIELRVFDDGVGFDPGLARNSHGLGLVSMRERLRTVDGEFSIWSKPSQGAQVRAIVPDTMKPVRDRGRRAADREPQTNGPVISDSRRSP